MSVEILPGVTVRPDDSIHHAEYGDLTLDVMAELAEMEKAARVEASVERLKIARQNREQGPSRHTLFGRVIAEVSEQDYDDQERLEPGCWTDKGFVKEFTKLIPESKVESKPDNPTILHPGLPGRDA